MYIPNNYIENCNMPKEKTIIKFFIYDIVYDYYCSLVDTYEYTSELYEEFKEKIDKCLNKKERYENLANLFKYGIYEHIYFSNQQTDFFKEKILLIYKKQFIEQYPILKSAVETLDYTDLNLDINADVHDEYDKFAKYIYRKVIESIENLSTK